MREVSTERLLKDVRRVLIYPFWIPTLKTMTVYSRLHDDNDGTERGRISVIVASDGDVHVTIDVRPGTDLRYRMPMQGGGRSPRTRNALMILAEAIRLDNLENPDPQPGQDKSH